MYYYNYRRGYKNRYQNNKLETSKKLAFTITVLFILTATVSWVSSRRAKNALLPVATWFIQGNIPEQLLNFTAVPFMIIITGYFSKACIENREKIKNTDRI